jgi:hypothetical protein
VNWIEDTTLPPKGLLRSTERASGLKRETRIYYWKSGVHVLLAMQKVVGSSPISRFVESRSWSGFSLSEGFHDVSAETLFAAIAGPLLAQWARPVSSMSASSGLAPSSCVSWFAVSAPTSRTYW